MVSSLNGKMVLQCMKCDKYFRSFSRIKYHKSLQCSGEVKEEKKDDVIDNSTDNPWSYNLKTESSVKTETKQEKIKIDASDETAKIEAAKVTIITPSKVKDRCRCKIKEEYIEADVKVKGEPVEAGGDEESKAASKVTTPKGKDRCRCKIKEEYIEAEVKVKGEPVESKTACGGRRDPYEGGVYKPAPVIADSDSEYEAESDDSAPEEDDIETHLGMLTKWNPHKADQPKVRKRKRSIPENGKVVFMVSASGQQIKKIKMTPKESKKFVPSHPWIPYHTQVTVEQCCQFLELKDYPVVVNEDLKEKFKDKSIFDEYALPLLKSANPTAHPLTLSTLLKAKWFEVMNTETLPGDANNSQDSMDTGEDTRKAPKQQVFSRQARPDKKPVLKNIKVNFNY